MRYILLILVLAVAALAQNPVERVVTCTDAGSSDAYACTPAPAVASYTTGLRVRLKANTANTGAATVNISAVGAGSIKKVAGGITTDLADNDIRAGQYVDLIYDGTNFQMLSQLGNAATGGSSFDPMDQLTLYVVEEFLSGGSSGGALGAAGIRGDAISSGTVSGDEGPETAPGIIHLRSTTAANSGYQVSMMSSITGAYPTIASMWASHDWEIQARVALGVETTGSVAESRVRIGLVANIAALVPSTAGLFFRFDKDAGYADTTWKVQVCDSTSGCALAASGTDGDVVDTGIAPTAGTYQLLKLRRSGGNYQWAIDSGSWNTISTTNVRNDGTTMAFAVANGTTTTTARWLGLDRMAQKIVLSSR